MYYSLVLFYCQVVFYCIVYHKSFIHASFHLSLICFLVLAIVIILLRVFLDKFCLDIYFHFSCYIYRRIELQGHVVIIELFEVLPIFFQSTSIILYSHFSTSLPSFVIVLFFIIATLVAVL